MTQNEYDIAMSAINHEFAQARHESYAKLAELETRIADIKLNKLNLEVELDAAKRERVALTIARQQEAARFEERKHALWVAYTSQAEAEKAQ